MTQIQQVKEDKNMSYESAGSCF